MISSKDLTDVQIQALKEWTSLGEPLGEIQKKLNSEFNLKATYLDTRFLLLDLNLEIAAPKEQEPEEENTEEAAPQTQENSTEAQEVSAPLNPAELTAGEVHVTLDQVTQAGMLYNGQVVFSDGEQGRWCIDTAGKPGITPQTPNYQPKIEDIETFQTKLRALLSK